MGISCPCYSILLREKVTCLTSDCDKARNVSKLPAFSEIESGRIILPLTPERGIHIMPPVNTTRFTLRGYSSAGRALAWHARGQRFRSLSSPNSAPADLVRKEVLWGYSSFRRALAWHARGQQFDPLSSTKIQNPRFGGGFVLAGFM